MKRYISALAATMAFAISLAAQEPEGNDENIIYKDDINSVHLAKTVTESTNGEYQITLSSFVTGTKETHESTIREPIDFTLVLDMSSSMENDIGGEEYFPHFDVQLAINWVKYNGNYAYCPYGVLNSYGNYCTYYFKHTDGNYYPVKSVSFTWNGLTYYCQYFETNETVTNPVTGSRFKKRYFLGDTTNGYDADCLAGLNIPVERKETGSASEWSGYRPVTAYCTTDYYGILFRGTLYSQCGMSALWNAMASLYNVILEDDTENLNDETGHHRIGIVKFADAYSASIGNNTYPNGYSYSQIVNTQTPVGDYSDFSHYVQTIEPGSWTRTDYGLRLASEILSKSNNDGKTRKHVVILFSDGTPEDGYNNFTTVSNLALPYAKSLKANGVEIYSIIFRNSPSQNAVMFMEYSSSDYPDASSLSDPGDKAFDKYLFIAHNGEQLDLVFRNIGLNTTKTEIGYNLTESNQVVFDALTKHFLLPDDVTSSDTHRIGVYTRDFLGIIDGVYSFSEKLTPLPGANISLGGEDNREIIVSGFNFAENWCGLWRRFDILGIMHDSWQGKELVITIPIVVDPANPGGASMVTNEASSGIYNDDGTGHPDFDHPLKPFPIPEVSLPNIVVVKNGMKTNNSAIFVVTRLNADGTEDSTYEPFTVMAIADGTGTAKIRLKLVGEGRYKVSEQSWSWAYDSTPTATYAKDDGHTSVQGNTITRNVLGATADSTENGTLYIFTNTDRKNIPAHDEDAVNNVFFTPQVVIQ